MKGKIQKIRNLISNISVKEKYKIKNHQKENKVTKSKVERSELLKVKQ